MGSRTVRGRSRHRLAIALAGALVVLSGTSALPAVPSVVPEPRALYVVQLAVEPPASFTGDAGYPATSPTVTGAKLDIGIVTFHDAAVPSSRNEIESRLLVVHYEPAD